MELRKDDPVYYKKKISDLLNQAKENNLEVKLVNSYLTITSRAEFGGIVIDERVNVNLKEICEDA